MVAPEWPPTTVTFSFAGSVPLISEMKRLARTTDRKSTRLNSSHSQISYAVFCLKKKKINHRESSSTEWPCNLLLGNGYRRDYLYHGGPYTCHRSSLSVGREFLITRTRHTHRSRT